MNILETPRLCLREMTWDDYPALCRMLKDPDVMYAYEHAFSDEEARAWMEKQLARYREYGFGLWAVILKETKEMIGQCGLTMQDCGREQPVLEIGYLFEKAFWHQGYASESAIACKRIRVPYPPRQRSLFDHPGSEPALPEGSRTERNDAERQLCKALLWNGYASYHFFGEKPGLFKIIVCPGQIFSSDSCLYQ